MSANSSNPQTADAATDTPAPQTGQVVANTVPVSAVHQSVNQELIYTTVDKVRLVLIEHAANMERRGAWIEPLGLFIALLVVFPTTTFQPFLGFSGDAWHAVFIVATIAAAAWTVVTAIRAWSAPSVDDVIDRLKNGP